MQAVLGRMDEDGAPPDHATYSYLANFCKLHNHLELAVDTFKHMRARYAACTKSSGSQPTEQPSSECVQPALTWGRGGGVRAYCVCMYACNVRASLVLL